MNSYLHGAPTLMRLILRRDRIRISLWIIIIPALVAATAGQIAILYPTPESLQEFAVSIEGNKALAALTGPTHGTDVLGGRLAYELWQTGMMIAVMAVIAVPRHTRAEEETDRMELLRATVIGRHAMSAASLGVAAASSVAIGVGVTVVLLANDLEFAGSAILGASFAAIGLVFCSIGLLTSQVTHHARSAKGLALGFLGLSFIIRAVGDSSNEAISLLSPLGWMQATQPFAGNHWWAIALSLAFAAAVCGVGFRIEASRDLGAGILPVKPGPERGAPALGGFFGLGWRLHRGSIAAWVGGTAAYAAAMGSILNSLEEIVGDNEEMLEYIRELANGTLVDIFAATMLLYFSLLATGFGIAAVLKMRAEETSGRLEHLLSHPASRRRWALGHVGFALVGGLAVLVASGVAMGAMYAMTGGGASELPRVALSSLAYAPTVAVSIGVATMAFGWLPKFGHGVWAFMVYNVFVASFAELIGAPLWLQRLSPMHHTTAVPAESVSASAVIAMLLISAACIIVGIAGFERRDALSS